MTRARLDQHFLIDPAIADRIVDVASPQLGETIVEIGPGHGILTERLLAKGARVTAIEIDERLQAELAGKYAGRDELKLVRSDFLELDLATLPSPCKIVSNLPYSVATPILQRFMPWDGWTQATLMFQKEVAERIEAGPGSRDYGILSVSVGVYADASPLFDVGRYSFRPPPQVQSAVLRLQRAPKPRLPDGVSTEEFFRVVKAAFAQRRKMAANSIASALGLERAAVVTALESCGIEATARGETIGLSKYASLVQALRR